MLYDKHPNNPANIQARIKEEKRLAYFENYVRDKQITTKRVDFWDRNPPQYSLTRLQMKRYPLVSKRQEYNQHVNQRRIKLVELYNIEKQQYQLELLNNAHALKKQ
nr:unnamed protein product [Naegleria fowleri]